MIKYKTKAQTLIGISSKLKKAKVCKSFIFSIDDWLKSQTNVVKDIQLSFKDTQIIVRSSALGEDGIFTSMAGAFDSVKDISSNDTSKLILGIDTVISSYGKNCNKKNEVLIQSMVKNVSISGVVFTHELNNGSPYYVINYDDISGQTDTVTSGGGEYANRTLYVHRSAFTKVRSERFFTLLESIHEVEGVMESQFLDIEFAIDKDLQVYILQVRAITTQKNWNRSIVKNVDKALNGIEILLRNTLIPINGLYGESTVLGQMPDWNPAEMIGRAPRALAYSLYEMLITDDAWRIARKKMGYSEPLKQPLMISLSGQPFIDTRLSFHSYLPSNLHSEICQKLVNVWLKKLKDNPQLHDKIEFDIAITTYSFDIDEKIKRLIGDRLTKKEKKIIKKSYFDLTFKLLSDDHPGSIKQANEKLNLLVEKQSFYDFKSKNLDFHQLNSIIDDCINLGTIPFSILARHGFIAKTLMLSLVSRGLLSQKECDLFFSSISTIATELVNDMHFLQSEKLDIDSFMEKYGHLRPGTYDITSLRYDQMSEFGQMDFQMLEKKDDLKFELTKQKEERIDLLLKKEGFTKITCQKLFKYIENATKAREFGKFIFTRNLSFMLEILANFGEKHFLSRDELSHIPIREFLAIFKHSDVENIEDRLRRISNKNKEKLAISSAIRLPQVLYDFSGIGVIPFQVTQPNFITDKKLAAKSINVSASINPKLLINKIVLIENADPGFDWIFSQKIAGLITKYGGANSHMAIRCAEFKIAAAIGCGEQRYEILLKAHKIMLDCSSSLIKVMK